ncbi:MAG: hypothetical protein HQL68_10035 [Magnetococcales bacterium]|nr:hypothetical protein [Magnetococcales bacterium]
MTINSLSRSGPLYSGPFLSLWADILKKVRSDANPTSPPDLASQDRVIRLGKDDEKIVKLAKLDGCYVLKTDLTKQAATKEVVHNRYKDLALVEQAIRESKTVHLEMRPINEYVMMNFWVAQWVNIRYRQ